MKKYKTRSQKRKSIARKKRRIKFYKKILRNIIFLIIGFASSILILMYNIERLLMKITNKLSFRMKLTVFVVLISLLMCNQDQSLIINKTTNLIQINKIVDKVEAKEEIICNFGNIECQIYAQALKSGLNEDQSRIAIAISKWETGNYSSYMFKNKNNLGGMYFNGSFMKFDSLEEGIESFINNLKFGYFDKGLNSIEEIQKKYCPVGAKNDPNGLNKNWIDGVYYFYNKLT